MLFRYVGRSHESTFSWIFLYIFMNFTFIFFSYILLSLLSLVSLLSSTNEKVISENCFSKKKKWWICSQSSLLVCTSSE